MSTLLKTQSHLHRRVVGLKKMLFSFYWLIALIGGFALSVVYSTMELKTEYAGAILGGLLAFCYFIQQQKLAEATFFRQVFSEFNARYDDLNDELSEILKLKAIGDKKKVLVDYFNLCSEEYLMFERGFIPLEVWDSWLEGMRQYWNVQEVKALWKGEIDTKSYYGFNPTALLDTHKVDDLKSADQVAA